MLAADSAEVDPLRASCLSWWASSWGVLVSARSLGCLIFRILFSLYVLLILVCSGRSTWRIWKSLLSCLSVIASDLSPGSIPCQRLYVFCILFIGHFVLAFFCGASEMPCVEYWTSFMLEVGLVVVVSAVGLINVLTWWGRHNRRVFQFGGVLPCLLLALRFCCRWRTCWGRLHVAWVVDWMLDNEAVTITLPSLFLWTWTCAHHSRGTSLDTNTKLGGELPCSFICL